MYCWGRFANILLTSFASVFIKDIGLWFSFFVVFMTLKFWVSVPMHTWACLPTRAYSQALDALFFHVEITANAEKAMAGKGLGSSIWAFFWNWPLSLCPIPLLVYSRHIGGKDWPKRNPSLVGGSEQGKIQYSFPGPESVGVSPFHALGSVVTPWRTVGFEFRPGFVFCLSHRQLHYLEAVI